MNWVQVLVFIIVYKLNQDIMASPDSDNDVKNFFT